MIYRQYEKSVKGWSFTSYIINRTVRNGCFIRLQVKELLEMVVLKVFVWADVKNGWYAKSLR